MIVDRGSIPWMLHQGSEGQLARPASGRSNQEAAPQSIATLGGEPLALGSFARVVDGVAVIPVYGPLLTRYSWAFWSHEEIARDLRLAAASTLITAVVLDIDSPGGQAAGCGDLAAELRRFSESGRPIVAHGRGMVASAAYWIAAACDRILIASGTVVGSIGAMIRYLDLEPLILAAGAELVEVVSKASPNKVLPPNSDEGQAELQAIVDAAAAEFIAGVATGRGVSDAVVRSQFGGGLVFSPADARQRGMIDGHSTLAEIVAGLAAGGLGSLAEPAPATPETDPEEEYIDMDLSNLTAEELAAARPDLVEQIAQESTATTDQLDAARADGETAGRKAECARQIALGDLAIDGQEDALAAARADTSVTPEAFAMKSVGAAKQAVQAAKGKGGTLEQLTADEKAAADVPAAQRQSAPTSAEAEWQADAKLQGEFPTQEAYAAWKAHQAA